MWGEKHTHVGGKAYTCGGEIPTWFLKDWKNILKKIYGIKNSEKQHIKSISQLEKNSALVISKLK